MNNYQQISRFGTLDELLEFENNLNFIIASENRNLNIDLIRKHQDKVNWYFLSKWINQEILFEFKHKINARWALNNPNFNLSMINISDYSWK